VICWQFSESCRHAALPVAERFEQSGKAAPLRGTAGPASAPASGLGRPRPTHAGPQPRDPLDLHGSSGMQTPDTRAQLHPRSYAVSSLMRCSTKSGMTRSIGARRALKQGPVSRHAPRRRRRHGDDVEMIWRSRGDRVKIVALRAAISPASAAGHVGLSPILTRGTFAGRSAAVDRAHERHRRSHSKHQLDPTAVCKTVPYDWACPRSETSRPECASANGFASETGRDGGRQRETSGRPMRPSPGQRDAPERRRRGETCVVVLIT
jgi:hypothetical protein